MEIGLIIIFAGVIAYALKILRQPLIPAYILAGIFIVSGLHLVEVDYVITTMSEFGIAFLLFIVGLEIDFNRLKDVGFVSTIGGTILTASVFFVSFIVAGLFGFTGIEALYIGLILAFSSTMVVIKLLVDKQELNTLHGRIILGILLMQDIIAIIALFVLSTLDNFTFVNLSFSLLTVILIFIATFLLSKYIFPSLFAFAAKSRELLFLTSITICLLYTSLFSFLNLSIGLGAFIAGVALANLPYNMEIASRIRPLRDFFAVIFFVSLGMQLNLDSLMVFLIPTLALLMIVLLVKPFFTMVTLSFFGYKPRPSFLASISLAQISEFSLIIVMFGVMKGHIQSSLFSSVVFIAIITFTLTTYYIQYENDIYRFFSRFLKVFDKITRVGAELEYIPEKMKFDVVLCGYDRLGFNIFNTLKKMKNNFLVIDFNPEVIKRMISDKVPCIYGDIADLEVVEKMDLKNIKMLISTIPSLTNNRLLIRKLKEVNKKAQIFVTSNKIESALKLYAMGADYVILPHFLGGERVSLLLEETHADFKKLLEYKLRHIKELKGRRILGHEHPRTHRKH